MIPIIQSNIRVLGIPIFLYKLPEYVELKVPARYVRYIHPIWAEPKL